MIAERGKTKCPVMIIDGKETECPIIAVDTIDNKRKNKRTSDISNTSSSSIVMPPHPAGRKSLPIVGHIQMVRKLTEGGEPASTTIKAFNMCNGDMSCLDILLYPGDE